MIGIINISSIFLLAKDPYNALQLHAQGFQSSRGVAELRRRADFEIDTLTACPPPLGELNPQQMDNSGIHQMPLHPAPPT